MKQSVATHTDSELCALISHNDKLCDMAFNELYNRHSRRIYQYCRYIVGNENAEDIFQETFLRFLNALKRNDAIANPPAFLLRIARNLCLNHKNKKNIPSVEFDDELGIYQYDAFSGQQKQDFEFIIASALELLPADHKEAFVFQQFCDMTYSEISEEQNVPVTTVRNRIVRAKKKLRELLSWYLEESLAGK